MHGRCDIGLHAPIGVYSQYLEIGTAVRFALATSRTGTARQVRFQGAVVSRSQPLLVLRYFHDFDSQLVTQYTWIFEVGLSSGKGVQISSTDSDPMYPDNGLVFTWLRYCGVSREEFSGLIKHDLSHCDATPDEGNADTWSRERTWHQ